MASPDLAHTDLSMLQRLEVYYDAVPRSSARAEDFGPLSLFVQTGAGWPYYARPALGHTGPTTAAHVQQVRERQRELGIPESFEWVAETSPDLRAAVEQTGLTVHEHPLMVLTADADAVAAPTGGVTVRMIGPEDPDLAGAITVPQLAFAALGTAIGKAGPAELAEEIRQADMGTIARIGDRMRAGLTATAAAVEDGVVLCAGQHQPVGETSEIVGVGTLPSARRRGLAGAVTQALVDDARARGVETIFLSASDDAVARVYGRLGFRRVGTALIAEAA